MIPLSALAAHWREEAKEHERIALKTGCSPKERVAHEMGMRVKQNHADELDQALAALREEIENVRRYDTGSWTRSFVGVEEIPRLNPEGKLVLRADVLALLSFQLTPKER